MTNTHDHTHRDDDGNHTPCDLPKAECDALHQAHYDRMEEFDEKSDEYEY